LSLYILIAFAHSVSLRACFIGVVGLLALQLFTALLEALQQVKRTSVSAEKAVLHNLC